MPNSSPLMGMPVPVIGPTGDPGPAWATYLNQCLGIIDSHDHTSGNGAQVPTNGININSDLNFNLTNVIGARSYRCATNLSTLTGTGDKGCLYNLSGDLYWNNGSGVAVKLTSGTGINIAGVAGFYGDYAQPGVPAAATYSNITKTFSFTQDTGKSAIMAGGTYQLYETGALGANPVNLKSPTALGASYDVIFPTVAPSTNSLMRFDSSGNGTFINVLGTTGSVTVTQNAGDITLSTPLIVSGTWSPSIFNNSNVTSVSFSDSFYMRVNNVITFHNTVVFTVPITGAYTFQVNLPFVKLSGSYTSSSYIFLNTNSNASIFPIAGTSVYQINGSVAGGTVLTVSHSTTYSIS